MDWTSETTGGKAGATGSRKSRVTGCSICVRAKCRHRRWAWSKTDRGTNRRRDGRTGGRVGESLQSTGASRHNTGQRNLTHAAKLSVTEWSRM